MLQLFDLVLHASSKYDNFEKEKITSFNCEQTQRRRPSVQVQ